MIRRARYILAAAGSAAILAGGMALAGAGAASANTLPSCANGVNCFTSVAAPGSIFQNGGVAGYYGADDGHTQYRWVQTVVNASPELVDLNGPLGSELYPASTGVQLCDPNSGVSIQLALGFVGGKYQIAYEIGKFPRNTTDPCIQSNFQTSGNIFKFGHLLQFVGISAGDQIFMSISYNPNAPSHVVLFNACDQNTSSCRQAHIATFRSLHLYNFGIGTFTPANVLTGGAVNEFQHFSSSYIQCYSCAAPVWISTVQSVGPFGNGGLWESQFANSSSQVVMSPNDTLGQPTGGSFSMYNGSTSI